MKKRVMSKIFHPSLIFILVGTGVIAGWLFFNASTSQRLNASTFKPGNTAERDSSYPYRSSKRLITELDDNWQTDTSELFRNPVDVPAPNVYPLKEPRYFETRFERDKALGELSFIRINILAANPAYKVYLNSELVGEHDADWLNNKI